MPERGVKIGAFNNTKENRDVLGDRMRFHIVRRLSPQESEDLGYQTRWPSLIHGKTRIPNNQELDHFATFFTTPKADSRINPLFINVDRSAMDTLRGYHLRLSEEPSPWEDNPLLALAPGIEVRIRNMQQDPDRPTTAGGELGVGLHRDHEGGVPVKDRETVARRAVVALDAPHSSLLLPSYNVFDLSEMLYPGELGYVPKELELMPKLVELTEGEEELITIRMGQGEAVCFSAANTFHDGVPNIQERAYTVVTFETEWSEEALIAASIFA